MQPPVSEAPEDIVSEGVACERTRCDDRGELSGEARDFFAVQVNAGRFLNHRLHVRAEFLAVHREGRSRGDARRFRRLQKKTSEEPELLLQESVRSRGFRAFKTVGTNELREVSVAVRGRLLSRTHLVEFHVKTARSELESRFAAGETSADDADAHQLSLDEI